MTLWLALPMMLCYKSATLSTEECPTCWSVEWQRVGGGQQMLRLGSVDLPADSHIIQLLVLE